MKLGLLTVPFGNQTLTEVADWSAANHFTALEIACWPSENTETRRYAGTCHIAVETLTQAQATDIRDELTAKNIDISALSPRLLPQPTPF